MNPPGPPAPYTQPRVPADMISHGVWLYGRFRLSSREGDARRFARGLTVTDEAIRTWGQTLGPPEAHQRRRPPPGDTWPRDEV